MQQIKNLPRQFKPVRQKLQKLSQGFVKFKQTLEKFPQVQRDRLFTLVLVLLLGFGGWYEYNEQAGNFDPESFPVITPRTVQDIEVGFDLIASGHQGVLSVAVNSDLTIASGNSDGTLNLWNLESNIYKTMNKFEGQKIESVAFSPDSNIVATGNSDGTIQLWYHDSEKNTFNQSGEPLQTSAEAVLSVAFSPDGKILASGNSDGTIQLWNQDSQKNTFKLGEPLQTSADKTGAEAVWSVVFSPDGKILASGSDNGILKLWDVEKRRETDSKPAHQDPIYSVAFSSAPSRSRFFLNLDKLDKQQLASGSYDGTIKLWNIDSSSSKKIQGTPKILTPHNQLLSIALSKDGKILASGSDDGTIKLWNTLSGQPLRTLKSHPYGVLSLAFDGDSQTLVSGSYDETVKVWRVRGKAKAGWKFPDIIKFYPN